MKKNENRKKNLLIVGSSQGVYGGLEAFMIAIAEAANKWNEFETILCFKLASNTKPDVNLTSIAAKVSSKVIFVSKGSFQLLRLVYWSDIIHAQNVPPDVVLPATLFNKKLYLTIHNRYNRKLNIHNILWKSTFKLARKRWFNSNFVWNTWEPGIKSSNSSCVPTVSKLPEVYSPTNERKGFLFIGRWIKNKGIEELIQAYALGKFNTLLWPLTILGDGPLKNDIVALIDQYKIEVITPGFVNDSAKENFLSSAKWLVAPAKTMEDLGLTPIEARSIGVPSIVTQDGGLPESAGPFALIAEPGNVEDLTRCMQIAVNMDEKEYIKRCELGKKELTNFLKPIEFYKDEFLK